MTRNKQVHNDGDSFSLDWKAGGVNNIKLMELMNQLNQSSLHTQNSHFETFHQVAPVDNVFAHVNFHLFNNIDNFKVSDAVLSEYPLQQI